MDQTRNFFSRLLTELRDSLVETFGLFDSEATTASVLTDVLNHVLVSALLILLFVGVYAALRAGLRFVLKRTNLSTSITGPMTVALRYTMIVLAALAIMSQFGVPNQLSANAARAAVVAFIFYLAWIVSQKVLGNVSGRYSLDQSILQLLRNLVSVVLIAFGIAAVLSQVGVDIVAAVGALGIAGIAVGFAAQDTLSNFISGVTLLLERPFRIGDWVEINGQVGKVKEITLRNTLLVTRDNIVTHIPNASVGTSDIINFSAGGPLRINVPIGIAYKESSKHARKVIMPILNADERVMRLPAPSVRLVELGDSSVNLMMIYWIEPNNIAIEPKISADILEASKEALDEAGIEIPFPHLQLFIDGASGLRPVMEPLYSVEQPRQVSASSGSASRLSK